MRVLTMNLFAPGNEDWPPRRAVVAEGFAELAPDLVALQETVWGDGYDQAADLLGPDYDVARHSGRSADGVGAALASRWPIGAVRELDLHLTPRTQSFPWCAALTAEIDAPEPIGPLLFVHHKPSYEQGFSLERERQAVATARFAEELLDAGNHRHVIVAGDFDDTPDSASLRFWTGRQSLDGVSVRYEDAWEAARPGEAGHTFTPANPLVAGREWALERGRRIDYVLVRCATHGPTLDTAGCELAFDRPVGGVQASDHYGVVADLTVPERVPGPR